MVITRDMLNQINLVGSGQITREAGNRAVIQLAGGEQNLDRNSYAAPRTTGQARGVDAGALANVSRDTTSSAVNTVYQNAVGGISDAATANLSPGMNRVAQGFLMAGDTLVNYNPLGFLLNKVTGQTAYYQNPTNPTLQDTATRIAFNPLTLLGAPALVAGAPSVIASVGGGSAVAATSTTASSLLPSWLAPSAIGAGVGALFGGLFGKSNAPQSIVQQPDQITNNYNYTTTYNTPTQTTNTTNTTNQDTNSTNVISGSPGAGISAPSNPIQTPSNVVNPSLTASPSVNPSIDSNPSQGTNAQQDQTSGINPLLLIAGAIGVAYFISKR
jgi:hypothetical protein